MADARAGGRTRRTTAADVAKLSGVSRATVSYVLNNVPGQTIPDSTQERIRAAAAALGYVPSAAAASLRRGHSRIVLVVTEPALSGYVTEPFLASIADRLTESGLTPLTLTRGTEESLLALVREVGPYGVLALTVLSPTMLREMADLGVPRVYSSAHGDPTFPRPWEEEIGAIQARRLLEGGCTHIVYAAPVPDNPRIAMARSRELGIRSACATAGMAGPRWVELPADLGAAIDELRGVIQAGPRVGIAAFDDTVAAVALAALRELNIPVPDLVAVIGVDDEPFAPFLTPPLTTLAIDGRQSGRLLAERFLEGQADSGSETASRAWATVIERSSA